MLFTITHAPVPYTQWVAFSLLIGIGFNSFAFADNVRTAAVSNLGTSGGLVIPSAEVLSSGEFTIGKSNYMDPTLGRFSKRENYHLGIGFLPGIELIGRLAEYQNPPAFIDYGYDIDIKGVRDLSANVKWQLPTTQIPWLPNLAIGYTDISGGVSFFKSAYGVASAQYHWINWTLGIGKNGKNPRQSNILNGVFGGLELSLPNTGLSLLAETDGTQKHIGARYRSQPISLVNNARIIASIQRTSATTSNEEHRNSFNLSINLPTILKEESRQKRTQTIRELPAFTERTDKPILFQQKIDQIEQALAAAGMDRIAIGQNNQQQLVIDYENYRYLHNEVDALGIVLAIATELSPATFNTLVVRTIKSGNPTLSTTVHIDSFRQFLRDSDKIHLSSKIKFEHPSESQTNITWLTQMPRKTGLRLEVSPLLGYTMGTEYGVFDHSLGMKVRARTNLWKGAEIYSDILANLNNSDSMEDGEIFSDFRIKNGIKNLAIHQSFAVTPSIYAAVGMGRYFFNHYGVEGELITTSPWSSNDTMHLRGNHRQNIVTHQNIDTATASYRKKFNDSTWLEVGYNQFGDKSRGPSIQMTRWFDDVALELALRKGDKNTFASALLTLPFATRQSASPNIINLSGTARFGVDWRTRIVNDHNAANLILPNAVIPTVMQYKAEIEHLNSGRISSDYMMSQLQRMRESFMIHARDLVP